jgi:hypothetical protein
MVPSGLAKSVAIGAMAIRFLISIDPIWMGVNRCSRGFMGDLLAYGSDMNRIEDDRTVSQEKSAISLVYIIFTFVLPWSDNFVSAL